MVATAPRAFRRAAAKNKTPRPTLAFTLDWVDDEDEEKVIKSDVFHAQRPTDERLFLVAATMGDEDASGQEAGAVMSIFRDALPAEEYRTLRARLADPDDSVDMETIGEVMEWLMKEWTAFPTEPSPNSSTSPTTTGSKSTGRVRGTGSTRSPSPSTAS